MGAHGGLHEADFHVLFELFLGKLLWQKDEK